MKKNRLKLIVIMAVVLIAAVLVWWFVIRVPIDDDFPSPIDNAVETEERRTWARYTNEQFGFEVQYPDTLRPQYERGPGNSATMRFTEIAYESQIPPVSSDSSEAGMGSESMEEVGNQSASGDSNNSSEAGINQEAKEAYWFEISVTADEEADEITEDLVHEYLPGTEITELTRTVVGEDRVRAKAFQTVNDGQKVRHVWFMQGDMFYRFKAPYDQDVVSSRTISTLRFKK